MTGLYFDRAGIAFLADGMSSLLALANSSFFDDAFKLSRVQNLELYVVAPSDFRPMF